MDNEKIILEFMAAMKLRGCSPNTLGGYGLDLRQFFKAIGKKFDEINFHEVNAYFRNMVDAKATRTIARKMASVRAFYKWLVEEEYLKDDPTKKLKSPKMPKRVPKYLTDDEVRKVINTAKTLRDKTVMMFLYVTGCRIDELFKLNKDDINWEDHSVKVLGKGNKEGFIFLNDECEEMLRQYLSERKDNNVALFVDKDENRLSKRSIQKSVRGYGEKSGIGKKVTPHRFRHSMASRLVQEGIPIQVVSTLLRHQSISTTQIYACLDTKTVKDAYSSVFNKKQE